jgi:hypothetical protein
VTNRLRRRRLLAAVISTYAAVTLGDAAISQSEAECERETISMALSPDNQWIALVREGMCIAGNITVSTDTVQIVRRAASDKIELLRSSDDPPHENDVLVVDYYGHSENRPVLRWIASHELQVTIPNLSSIGMQRSAYDDVKVTVRFEPDDPEAREKWRKERGLPK